MVHCDEVEELLLLRTEEELEDATAVLLLLLLLLTTEELPVLEGGPLLLLLTPLELGEVLEELLLATEDEPLELREEEADVAVEAVLLTDVPVELGEEEEGAVLLELLLLLTGGGPRRLRSAELGETKYWEAIPSPTTLATIAKPTKTAVLCAAKKDALVTA